MADDDDVNDDEDAAAPAAAKSSSPMKLIIIIFVMLLLLGGAGAFVLVKFVLPSLKPPVAEDADQASTTKEKKDEKPAEEKKSESKFTGPMFELDPFVVNLAASGGRRFLKVTMQFEMSTSDLKEEMDTRVPQMRDTIITVLSNKTFDDIYTVHGKFKAREELIRRINTFLEGGQIMNVYFTEFVIQ